MRPEPELRLRLLREAPVRASIRHENLVTVRDFGETGSGDPFLVMELLAGETLAALLVRKGALPPQEAAAIGRDVALALAAAHERGLVHRHLEPASIFLQGPPGKDRPLVKVLDLGVGKDPGTASESPSALAYSSPELLLAEVPADGRTDVWSLGVVLYEMLTGRKPFEGDATSLLLQIRSAEPPPIWHQARKLHPGLAGLVMACLRRRPEERPWPVQEIILRLSPFAAAGRGRSLPPLPPLAIPLSQPPRATDAASSLETTVPLATAVPAALRDIEVTDGGTVLLPAAPGAPAAPEPPAPVPHEPAPRPVMARRPPLSLPPISLPPPAFLPPPPLPRRVDIDAPFPSFRSAWARPEVLGLVLGALVVLVAILLAAVVAGMRPSPSQSPPPARGGQVWTQSSPTEDHRTR